MTPELLRQARLGDRNAWDALFTHFAPVVHAVLLGLVEPATADDLVQETFLRAMAKLEQLQDDAAFGSWLCTIARREALQHRRRTRPWVRLPAFLSARSRPTAEASQVLQHLRALPETYRELLILRLVEGLTGPEIAERLGRTHGSVRVSLHRGMKLLRTSLGEP